MTFLRNIQLRIIIPSAIILILCLSTVGIIFSVHHNNTQTNLLEQTLLSEAKVTAIAAAPLFVMSDDSLNELASQAATESGSRITIFSADGIVMGDSQDTSILRKDYSFLPEVDDAINDGYGIIIRSNSATSSDYMYAAAPIIEQASIIGIIRSGKPVDEYITGIAFTVWSIIITVILGIIIISLIALRIAKDIAKPVQDMRWLSRALSSGNFNHTELLNPGIGSDEIERSLKDITENIKDLVEEISNERSKLNIVLTHMTDGVILADSEGAIILANQAAGKLFGFKPEEVIEKSVIEITHDHEIEDLAKRCVRSGKLLKIQLDIQPSAQFIRVIAMPIRVEELNGALLLIQDLTELRSLQTMRRELIGNISHDLRTPLAGIKIMAETLQDGAINDEKTAIDFLTRIGNEVDRVSQMVTELTELSRIEGGAAELDKEMENLNKLVSEAIAQMKPLADKKGISIKTELAENLPAIPLDRERISQTITNLTHNAIKFNRDNGTITISTISGKDYVTLKVTDSGIGISEDDLPHVFERFYKADKARSHRGSGLGLAIAKHTIEAHKGHIRVESKPHEGSTFIFDLPINP